MCHSTLISTHHKFQCRQAKEEETEHVCDPVRAVKQEFVQDVHGEDRKGRNQDIPQGNSPRKTTTRPR